MLFKPVFGKSRRFYTQNIVLLKRLFFKVQRLTKKGLKKLCFALATIDDPFDAAWLISDEQTKIVIEN
jgi:hypothetical protein